MEFINHLKESEDSIRAKTVMSGVNLQYFDALPIRDEAALSIQASYGHYCTPRQTLDLGFYKKMEVAILKNGELVSASAVTDDEALIEIFDKYYDGSVHSYVPVHLIERLYQTVKIEGVEG